MLNTAIIGRNDAITMSCFARPLTQAPRFAPSENVLNRLQGVGLETKLAPENKAENMLNMNEID